MNYLPEAAGLSNSDVIAISASAIALLALLATAWQAWLARSHNRLTVTPHITSDIDTTITDQGLEIKLTLKNVGVGPALIEDRFFLVDKQRFNPNEGNLIEAICKTIFAGSYKYHIAQNGIFGGKSVLPSGAEVVIARLFFPGAGAEAKPEIMKASNHAEFMVLYKCLYGRRFNFSTAN